MFGGDHLGEPFGFGRILLMAAAAEVGDVGEGGLERAGIVGVFGLGTVAGFARDVGVFAGRAFLGGVFMAQHTGVLTGESDGMLADGGQGAGTVVAVLAEVPGDHRAANGEEEAHRGEKNDGGSNQVYGVAE